MSEPLTIGALIVVVVLALLVLGALVWRPPRRRPRTPEEAVDDLALRAEQDRARTDAIRAQDRYNTRR
jgi:hypothetical protein